MRFKVSDNYVVPFMAQFATTTHHRVTNRKSNLSAKRNLGLLLGHLTSTNLFFLDDDIRNMTAAKLQGAGYALKDHAVAGFLSYEFPDNSVVRHAYRLSGGDQAVFIAGNSLAVNTSAIESFFPNVYNEDWLFFHDAIKQKRAATVGLVNQLPYDPFMPSRTTSEEFGCVLATEGLYTLLASGKPHTDADKKYWSEALTRRKIFVSEVKERLNKSGRRDAQFMRALLCLEAALHELEQYTPTDFTSYVKAWRKDLREWKELLRDLPTGLSLPEAINFIQETKLVSEIPLATGLSQNEINSNLVA